MTYGFEVYNAQGQLRLRHDDLLTRLAHQEVIPFGAGDYGYLSLPPGIDLTECVVIAQVIEHGYWKHEHKIEGNTIRWINGTVGTNPYHSESNRHPGPTLFRVIQYR